MVCYAIIDYWQNIYSNQYNEGSDNIPTSISAENLIFEPNSPEKCFLLDEDSMTAHLEKMAKISNGLIEFSDDSGIKQIRRHQDFDELTLPNCLHQIFHEKRKAWGRKCCLKMLFLSLVVFNVL